MARNNKEQEDAIAKLREFYDKATPEEREHMSLFIASQINFGVNVVRWMTDQIRKDVDMACLALKAARIREIEPEFDIFDPDIEKQRAILARAKAKIEAMDHNEQD